MDLEIVRGATGGYFRAIGKVIFENKIVILYNFKLLFKHVNILYIY